MGGMSFPSPPVEGRHVPVLAAEVVRLSSADPGQIVVDATVGAGGHASLLLERIAPGGRLIALDRDAAMLGLARRRLDAVASGAEVVLVQANFDRLREVLDEQQVDAADVVLADLGVCSDQLDDPARGFSFQQSAPLDMRLDTASGEPARALLGRLSERDLADIFWRYGEERFSRRIARKVVETRRRSPLKTTDQLADLVRGCLPRPRGRRQPIDPATRVFQALRIAVNEELGSLERFLAALPECVRPGGRAAVISFHSLEDRQVKQAFRDRSRWEVLTRKPVQAGDDEVARNPRARSAKLRVARRLAPQTG
jgi:16S rRNA (cytosine1402-N4)-methyltransferase